VTDPRAVLTRAAELKLPCELQPRQGAWQRGLVVRVEHGGVVLRMARPPAPGTDVHAWLTVEGRSWTFEASVVRVGVPVPDRSQDGVLLGYLASFREAPAGAERRVTLELLPHTGGPLAMEGGGARIVDLTPERWLVSVPRDFPVVLAVKSETRLRLGLSDRAPVGLEARVSGMARGEQHLVYTLDVTRAEDPERYTETLAAARALLQL
jgi:hypothetical protein